MDYKKLEETMLAAKNAALEAVTGENGGTANLDCVTIKLSGAREKKVKELAENIGLHISKTNWIGIRYFIHPPTCGQGDDRVRATEAMLSVFKNAGYNALMFCKID
jgi:hypothetical protein